MNDFADVAIFVQFYLFAAVDLILGTKVDTKQLHCNDKLSLSEEKAPWCPCPVPVAAQSPTLNVTSSAPTGNLSGRIFWAWGWGPWRGLGGALSHNSCSRDVEYLHPDLIGTKRLGEGTIDHRAPVHQKRPAKVSRAFA